MTVAINLEAATSDAQLADIAKQVCDSIRDTATQLGAEAGLPDMMIDVRLTDDYLHEIELERGADLPPFTTKRVGGDAVGRVRQPDAVGQTYQVLVNASAFDSKDSWMLSHSLQVIAHELAHCLIGQCRLVYGVPSGYFARPTNSVQVVSYTALSACDEYVADRLGHMLLPPVAVEVEHDGASIAATDRIVIGTNRLTSTLDELDAVVFPHLPDKVRQYQQTGDGLTELIDTLTRSVHEVMIMSAHYQASVRELPMVEPISTEVAKVSQHPGSRLLLDPFWGVVGPHLEHRFEGSPLRDFANQDQLCLDAAVEGLTAAWAALGVEFELYPDDAVFVHVSDPVEPD